MAQMDSDVAALHNPSEALRRKRERDKQNQRKKRHRDQEYIQTLLARIAHLEQEIGRSEAHHRARSLGHHHGRPLRDSFPEGTAFQEGCSSDTQSPQRLNVAVQTRDGLHNNLGHNSEQDPMTDSGSGTAQCTNFAASPLSDNTRRSGILATTGEGSMNECRVVLTTQSHRNGCSKPQNSVTNAVVPLRSLDMLLETPQWQRLPIISFLPPQVPQLLIRSESFGALLAHVRGNPDKLSSAPETPKAVDLLFGGSSNLLANAVSEEAGPYALLPPEKFAISWLSYLFLRVWPSQYYCIRQQDLG
ncbi:hypothetical protein MRS44_018649 [Fusarium solani]|uniref:uncharacterized protein n=1 Tax=Fusarium solani TaxID=169388 RepID=UPI0032C3DE09|nr:hypothetical protein MRS44_018649 [Fusarium solani]